MARAKNQGNGHLDRMDEAMTNMLQSQAIMQQSQAIMQQSITTLASRQADPDARIADFERRIEERFQRIENILLEHSRILKEYGHIFEEHGRILAALPDAVRDRMGFKPPGLTTSVSLVATTGLVSGSQACNWPGNVRKSKHGKSSLKVATSFGRR